MQMIGTDKFMMDYLSLCLQDLAHYCIRTQYDALKFLSNRIRSSSYESNRNKNPMDEAREIISSFLYLK